MDEIASLSTTEQCRLLRSGQVSSRELLNAYIEAIERRNGDINAVVTTAFDAAGVEADRADDAAAGGRWLGPLHGIPFTVKDALATAGIRSTAGASELRDHVPAHDATVVARLRSAGAIVMGKTNCPTWSVDTQTHNDLFGTTRNPHDLGRSPGGSSGGAAAAVSAAMTSFEIGTDIGGSIRWPAHCTGIYGLKPTYGLVPQRGFLDCPEGGTVDLDINVVGPLARSAEDLDLVLQVIAGPSETYERAWSLDLPDPTVESYEGLRVATWFDVEGWPMEARYATELEAMANHLAEAGAQVEPAHPPVNAHEQLDLFMSLIASALGSSLPPEDARDIAGDHLDWLERQRRRAFLQEQWWRWIADYDALLCPAAVRSAIPHTIEGDFFSRTIEVDGIDHSYSVLTNWSGLIGLTNLPAAVAPIGQVDSVPVGVQIVAPLWRDRDAIRIADLIGRLD